MCMSIIFHHFSTFVIVNDEAMPKGLLNKERVSFWGSRPLLRRRDETEICEVGSPERVLIHIILSHLFVVVVLIVV